MFMVDAADSGLKLEGVVTNGEVVSGDKKPVKLAVGSAVAGTGYADGFRWLTEHL